MNKDKEPNWPEATWRNATSEALLRDEVRLKYWRIVTSKNKRNKQKRIDSVLATWRDLLSVKRTINP